MTPPTPQKKAHLGDVSSFPSCWRQGAMATKWFASPILPTHMVAATVNGLPTAISSGTQSFLAQTQVYRHLKATEDTICL